MGKNYVFLLMFLVLGAGLFAQVGSASIDSRPQYASITIDNRSNAYTPRYVSNLSVGEHTLLLNKTGYEDYTASFNVTVNRTTIVNATLRQVQQNPIGTLRVYSNPAYAGVSVDNVLKGITGANVSVTVQNLSEGAHTLRVNRTGYTDYSGNVGIRANAVTTLTINLTRAAGDLYVNSTPTGARVYLNGRVYSSTNTKIFGLAAGNYALVLTKAGYRNYTQGVEIRAGGITSVNAGLERIPRGNIQFGSNPSGASIYLAGVYRGYTPRTLYDLPVGNTAYVLKKTYYQNYPGAEEVIDGQTASVMATLTLVGMNYTNNTNQTAVPVVAPAPASSPATNTSLVTNAITSVDDMPIELRRILLGS